MAHDIQYKETNQKHPYHIVDPSPWPLLISLSLGIMCFGLVNMFHNEGSTIFWIGLLATLANAAFWWRDVIKEAFVQKAHSAIVKIGFRYGMMLFIASEVMFFGAFFWAYFDASLFPSQAIGGIWPPAHIHTINPFDLPFMMTLILLLSGCTCTWAHYALIENNRRDMLRGLGLTVLLGFIFSGFQAYEYIHAHFGFTDTVYASSFYMATGFHGFHVIVGTIFLAVCWWRAYKNHFTPTDHFGFEAAAWYWHFVDVVWLFLFMAVYWYGA